MARRCIIANWKMNLTLPEAERTAREIADLVAGTDIAVGIAPAFPFLEAVRKAVQGRLLVGAQNLFWEERGAYTGEVSGPMLASMGLDFVIIGHSERRKLFGETDESVNKRARAALKHGLRPVICVGETLEQRESGRALEVVERQLARGLEGLDGEFDIAYEPVWAIGTGVNARPEQVSQIHGFIKDRLGDVRVLYGGSVKPANAGELARAEGVDGFLVGGASLVPGDFAEIVKKTGDL